MKGTVKAIKSELRPIKHESPLLHYQGAAHAKVPGRG
eukprot:CAMPEP_0173121552 /NCGR_PEP_ID=MMETSP1102-20130122/53391_1 /TAXON_ID=49646 /ORGANISM="Geminigera sp., Strain Caron Lab Isolate" /LENGTH=36 /DNA_ID= /DNA_START= /DNA_END= /DNA_ORIENTATION=